MDTEIMTFDGWSVAVIRLGGPMEVSGSAVLNGGSAVTDTIMIIEVPKDYDGDPVPDACSVRDGLSLPRDTVGFMTAAEVKYVFSTAENDVRGTVAWAAVTAGLSNQVVAGEELTGWEERHKLSKERAARLVAGTINTIGVSPVPLTEAGKYNLVIAMTEAKTAALASLGYKETGTTSDAVAVVCPAGGERVGYAGTGTDLGIAMARSVRSAVRSALLKRGDVPVQETLAQVLAGAGARPSDIPFAGSCADGGIGRLEEMESSESVRDYVHIACMMQRESDLGLAPGACGTAEEVGALIADAVGGQGSRDLYRSILSDYRGDVAGRFVRCALCGLAIGFVK
jgi:adenosylcobinamide hydrolase